MKIKDKVKKKKNEQMPCGIHCLVSPNPIHITSFGSKKPVNSVRVRVIYDDWRSKRGTDFD